MTPAGNQRWRERRDSYRPSGEVIDPKGYEVVELEDDATPKAFVKAQHYSGTYPAARFRFGLYRRGDLVGVAVFSHPCNDKVLTKVFPKRAARSTVELGRFVLLDDVPGNGETWMLARCFDQLRGRVVGVVSFSDPVPRTSIDGRVTFVGHFGTIYQAYNAVHLGRATPRILRLLPDGRVFNARTASKIRKLDQGWRYGIAELESHGAAPYRGGADPEAASAWLSEQRPAGFPSPGHAGGGVRGRRGGRGPGGEVHRGGYGHLKGDQTSCESHSDTRARHSASEKRTSPSSASSPRRRSVSSRRKRGR